MIILVHIIMLVVYGSIAIYYYYNKPEKVNNMYGYRSQLSMKNERTWKEANQFAASMQVIVAISLFVFQVFAFFCIGDINSVFSSAAFMVICSLLMIPITELHLRSLFDKKGDFKTGAITKVEVKNPDIRTLENPFQRVRSL